VADVQGGSWNASTVADFWTPARLAAATPVDVVPSKASAAAPAPAARPGAVAAADITTTSTQGTTGTAASTSGLHVTAAVATDVVATHAVAASVTSSSIAHSYHFGGAPATGVIFYASSHNAATHYCTASVVNSPKGNLIVMAAHCNPGSWMAYVPMYQHGAAKQPYGIWAVTKVFKDAHYGSTGGGTDYDYAFAQVAPNAQGKQIQAVTGGYVLANTSSYNLYVTALGYPKLAADPADQAIRCSPNYRTSRLPGFRQMVLYCTGFYGGTSGGPWITYFNGRTGYLVGLTGGYEQGGPNSWISYSPIFDSRIFSLFSYAQTH
jgi:hypothetical protein